MAGENTEEGLEKNIKSILWMKGIKCYNREAITASFRVCKEQEPIDEDIEFCSSLKEYNFAKQLTFFSYLLVEMPTSPLFSRIFLIIERGRINGALAWRKQHFVV